MPMDRTTIKEAVRQAEEFLARAATVLDAMPAGRDWADASRATGALRRQSMELTNALVCLRRPEA